MSPRSANLNGRGRDQAEDLAPYSPFWDEAPNNNSKNEHMAKEVPSGLEQKLTRRALLEVAGFKPMAGISFEVWHFAGFHGLLVEPRYRGGLAEWVAPLERSGMRLSVRALGQRVA